MYKRQVLCYLMKPFISYPGTFGTVLRIDCLDAAVSVQNRDHHNLVWTVVILTKTPIGLFLQRNKVICLQYGRVTFISMSKEVRDLFINIECLVCLLPVSYTHLDVYKRQGARSDENS